MNQSGFVLPSGLALYAIGALAVVAVLAGTYRYGRTDGAKLERTEWQTREKKADDAAAEKLAKLTTDKELKEREHASALVTISTQYQGELKNVLTKKDRLIADLRAGTVKLRDPGTSYSLSPNPVSATGAGAGRCDGDAQTGFSDELVEFLAGEASHADEIVLQLTACQANLSADRK